jgi:hypothetical protein
MSEERIRDYLMDELGDPDAPIGSRLWSLWVANEIRKTVYNKQQADQRLRWLVEAFKEHQGFQSIGFLSWEEFCERKLQKQADEVDKALTPVQRAAIEAQPLPTQSESQVGNKNAWSANTITKNDSYNCNDGSSHNTRGNNEEYLTARIARDRPDILDDMKAGKYRSVRAAAIEAGIVKPVQRFSMPDTPEAAGKYLAGRVGVQWVIDMVDSYYRHIEE